MRTLSRKRGSRTSLEKNLLTSLVMHGRISTTESKAKHIVPFAEQLLTRARVGDLAAKRHAATLLTTSAAVSRLFTVVIPALPKKESGFITMVKTMPRVGDAAPVAVISIAQVVEEKKPAAKSTTKDKEKKQ